MRRLAASERDEPPDHKEATLLMAKRNPTDRDDRDPSTLTAEDRKLQRALLALALDCHPEHLTVLALGQAIAGEDAGAAEADAFARALRDLALAGLLQTRAGRVSPTTAALRFHHLEED
jgi:hypothetical protein